MHGTLLVVSEKVQTLLFDGQFSSACGNKPSLVGGQIFPMLVTIYAQLTIQEIMIIILRSLENKQSIKQLIHKT